MSDVLKNKEFSPRPALTVMVLVLALMWVGGWAVLHWVWPQYAFRAYPVIPITFIVYAVAIALLTIGWENGVKTGRTTQQKVILGLMGVKMGKLLLSLIVILLYWKLCGENTWAFLIVFAIYYTVYLIMETLLYTNFMKIYKKK